MVDEMSAANATEQRRPKQEAHRDPFMDETVVDEHVADPEEGHSHARTHEEPAYDAEQLATAHHEARRDRRVKARERVVSFESPKTHLVMRAVNAPKTAMPHLAMEPTGPWLHHRCHEQRGDDRDDDVERRPCLGPAHHEAS